MPWIPNASTDQLGIIRPDGKTIFIWEDGTLSLNPQPGSEGGGSNKEVILSLNDLGDGGEPTNVMSGGFAFNPQKYFKESIWLKEVSLDITTLNVPQTTLSNVFLLIQKAEINPDDPTVLPEKPFYKNVAISKNAVPIPFTTETVTWQFNDYCYIDVESTARLTFSLCWLTTSTDHDYQALYESNPYLGWYYGTSAPVLSTFAADEISSSYTPFPMMIKGTAPKEPDTSVYIIGQANAEPTNPWVASSYTQYTIVENNLIPSGSITYSTDFDHSLLRNTYCSFIKLHPSKLELGRKISSIGIKMNGFCNNSNCGYPYSAYNYMTENVYLVIASLPPSKYGSFVWTGEEQGSLPDSCTAQTLCVSDQALTPAAHQVSTWTFSNAPEIPSELDCLILYYTWNPDKCISPPNMLVTGDMSNGNENKFYPYIILMYPEVTETTTEDIEHHQIVGFHGSYDTSWKYASAQDTWKCWGQFITPEQFGDETFFDSWRTWDDNNVAYPGCTYERYNVMRNAYDCTFGPMNSYNVIPQVEITYAD